VEISVTQARAELAELVNRVAYGRERVVLTRRGKAVAAIVSAEDLELLDRLLAERIDLTRSGPADEGAEQGRSRPAGPMRIAAEYRPDQPPRPPGFGR
jgi:prevent-host-death family protein